MPAISSWICSRTQRHCASNPNRIAVSGKETVTDRIARNRTDSLPWGENGNRLTRLSIPYVPFVDLAKRNALVNHCLDVVRPSSADQNSMVAFRHRLQKYRTNGVRLSGTQSGQIQFVGLRKSFHVLRVARAMSAVQGFARSRFGPPRGVTWEAPSDQQPRYFPYSAPTVLAPPFWLSTAGLTACGLHHASVESNVCSSQSFQQRWGR
jgi:hypothetical protein